MNTDWLQERIDVARATSLQRWRLGSLAVTSAAVAGVAAGFGIGLFLVVIVVLPAVVSTINAGTQTAVAVIVIVVVGWLGSTGDATSPAAVVVAVALFEFHAILALLAVTPHGATLASAVIRRWAQRSAIVGGATVALWAFVLVLEQREPPPDGVLLVLALGVLVAAAFTARARSLT